MNIYIYIYVIINIYIYMVYINLIAYTDCELGLLVHGSSFQHSHEGSLLGTIFKRLNMVQCHCICIQTRSPAAKSASIGTPVRPSPKSKRSNMSSSSVRNCSQRGSLGVFRSDSICLRAPCTDFPSSDIMASFSATFLAKPSNFCFSQFSRWASF